MKIPRYTEYRNEPPNGPNGRQHTTEWVRFKSFLNGISYFFVWVVFLILGFGRLALKVKRMLQLLLCAAILGEIALILALLLEIKLAEPVMIAVDRLKRGRGPLVVRIIAGSVLFVLVARVYGTINIIKRTTMFNPSVLMNMLQISLTGFLLFLSVILDRLHHYTREVSLLRTEMEAAQRENQTFQEEKNGRALALKILEQEIAKLRTNIMNTETEYETKAKGAKLEKTKVYALRKQYEGLLAEIDRVQEDNQILRSQLEWVDLSYDDKTKHARKRLH